MHEAETKRFPARDWPFSEKEETVAHMGAIVVIFPVALTIFTGWAARRSGLVAKDAWPGIETLSFRILIPAILIFAISGADLTLSRIGPLAIALVATLCVIGCLVLLVRVFASRDQIGNPALSTLFQTSTRWNAFVSLAAADLMGGVDGVLLIAVAMAVLVPIINVSNILVVATLVAADAGWRRVLKTVATNPLIIACAIGLTVNLGFGGLPDILSAGFEIVGRAALAVGLLCVGAGIEIRRFLTVTWRVVLGLIMRPTLAPAIFLGLGLMLGLSTPELTAGVLVMAVPAASNGFIVARAMGGDAELYADLLAWQTLVTLIVLPAYLALAATL